MIPFQFATRLSNVIFCSNAQDLEEEGGYDGYYSDDGGSEDEELPPKEELEYLELRQKTKESIRKNGRRMC